MEMKNVDQNVMLALVALKMGLIDNEAMVAALNTWAEGKDRSVGRILVAQEALAEARLFLAEQTMSDLLDSSGGDPHQATISLRLPAGLVETNLERLSDPEFIKLLGDKVNLPVPRQFQLLMRKDKIQLGELLKMASGGNAKEAQMYNKKVGDGVQAGEFRPMDTRIVMLGVIGMCNYLFRWYRPEGRLTPDEVADELIDMVMQGVRV